MVSDLDRLNINQVRQRLGFVFFKKEGGINPPPWRKYKKHPRPKGILF